MEDVPSEPLVTEQARLKLQSFALKANNVTYAASGFAIGYWKFFPTGVEGHGLLPVWGVAEVVESQSDAVAVGAKLYGFYPLANELVMVPKADGHAMIEDSAEHRLELPAVYNRYTPVGGTGGESEHMRALLQQLLATSYLLFDWLMDNDCFGAEQIIIGSASSKTGLGLCKFLAEPKGRRYQIVGLTSARNKEFVEGLGACDQVLDYNDATQIASKPSVYVDMSGNAGVKAALHGALKDQLKHSATVGMSHWDQFNPAQELAGPKPQFFFAPAQITKRREEWGPGKIEAQITEAWKRIAADASGWLTLKVHSGLDAAPAVYAALADGSADPREGHVVEV
jgi:hypothetical protein